MGAKLGSSKGPMADINVTPLIDVVLVLLVVFMVITPLLKSGMPVDLPEASQTVGSNDPAKFIVISVTLDRGIWVEQEQVATTADDVDALKSGLVDALNTELRNRPTASFLLKADENLEYKQIRGVLDLVSDAGFTGIMIATTKEH
jgi:biopolymer transport protein TolR